MIVGKFAVFVMLFSLASCSFTPKGSDELMRKIANDQRDEAAIAEPTVNQGRPLFLEAASYPQFLPNGDIWTGGVILINIGREVLPLNDLVDKYRGEHEPR